jgi:hypothetical protein
MWKSSRFAILSAYLSKLCKASFKWNLISVFNGNANGYVFKLVFGTV